MQHIKLTQYSHGGGCGCKIDAANLSRILSSSLSQNKYANLLVGNEHSDDAAVYAIDDERCIVSSTDFFTPIVDDPRLYGAIASVNAMSDIYAMGASPFMALAVLGWPSKKIAVDVANAVLEGSREICRQVGIPLAGGHSIDTLEPIFGLSVTGSVKREYIKRNSTAKPESLLYLTKPLGTGIVATAQKQQIVEVTHLNEAINNMLALNTLGCELGKLSYVNAMTDVTGFGLLGHVSEMCNAAHLSAVLYSDKIPKYSFINEYIRKGCISNGARLNWQNYASSVSLSNVTQKWLLSDPQTSGGLLIAIDETKIDAFCKFLQARDLKIDPIGKLTEKGDSTITVI